MEQLKSEIENLIFPSFSEYGDIKIDYNGEEIISSLRKRHTIYLFHEYCNRFKLCYNIKL
jgi:hypothetical protein